MASGTSAKLSSSRTNTYYLLLVVSLFLSVGVGILLRFVAGQGWTNFSGAVAVAVGGFFLGVASDRNSRAAGDFGGAMVAFGGAVIAVAASPMWF